MKKRRKIIVTENEIKSTSPPQKKKKIKSICVKKISVLVRFLETFLIF